MVTQSRREFLGGVGRSVGCAALGFALADRLWLARALTPSERERLRFGRLDPLVDLLQATPADQVLPLAVGELSRGTSLADLIAAAALANARGFGGSNYNGYHAFMALMPSYEMAAQMPEPYTALPVLKVLHRNARFLQETGSATADALAPLAGTSEASLVDSVRARDLPAAELGLAALAERSPEAASEELQAVVRDEMNVHRVVLAWRAYDILRLTGPGQALTVLRPSVRFCIEEDRKRAGRGEPPNEIVELLPRLLRDHGLEGRERGTRAADEPWIERLADTVFSADRASAAAAVAAAFAQGFDPEDVGQALSLAATRLVLHDRGQTQESPGKPVGSVHGASVGVHASDAANAWRHIARLGSARSGFASLIAGAFHTAGQSGHVDELPFDVGTEPATEQDPAALRSEIDARIRARDQQGACRAARRYTELGHPSDALFALLLEHAVSEDGALHAEKYFRTVQESHASARPAHRGAHLVALTRVMASHHGFPAPGCSEARELLAG
jgi:hypothetical protein